MTGTVTKIENFAKLTFRKKKFLTMLFTASCSLAVSMLLLISDSVIAGHMIGENAIAAIEIVAPMYGAVFFFSSLVSDGVSTLYTEAVGSMDQQRMSNLFSEGVIFTAAVSLIVAALVIPFGQLYINSYDVSLEIRELAKEYLLFNVITYAFTPIFMYFSCIIYAEGDESVCNISYIVNFTANIVISVLACRFMGIKGIGFGTMCGTLLSICVLCIHFFKKTNTLHFKWHVSIKDLPQIMKFSFVDASAYLYQSVAVIILNHVIVKTSGEFYLPVFSAVISFIELQLILDGIGEALTPIVNIYRGENNIQGEKSINKYAGIWAGIEGVLFVILVQLLAPLLPSLLGIETAELYTACVVAFRMVSFAAIGTSFIYFLSSYYILSGHIMLGSVMCGLNILVFPVGIGSIMSARLGINGIWCGYIVASLLTLMATAIYIACRYGVAAVPFMYPQETQEMYTFELALNEEEIIATRNRVSDILHGHKISTKTINYVMIVCEDVLLLIKERNKDRKIFAECTLILDNSVKLIVRDDGEVFDITDTDLEVTSLRSMFVSSVMEHWQNKTNMVTMSYNRNVLKFESGLEEREG